jgi:hypothetical protein
MPLSRGSIGTLPDERIEVVQIIVDYSRRGQSVVATYYDPTIKARPAARYCAFGAVGRQSR